ncbi:MAG: dUTP diphosphatase [Deltaproteobacteria bacterium]|nr:MAG: dUTP diphosphatase [Deltaproteobacteria bacterium]
MSHRCTVKIEVLPHGRDLPLPSYETPGAAGLDLRAAIRERDPLELEPMERLLIPTGLKVAIPRGFEGQIRPRSGTALRTGLTLANSPGTIDSDYRGEVKMLVVNLGTKPVRIERGMRIAQLVICPVARAQLQVVDSLPATRRGAGGFGSTGED